MRYSEATLGRVFVLRLEDGDVLNETIEQFASEHGVERGVVFFLGGSADGSRLVVGPDAERKDAIIPLTYALQDPHETLGVGTLFPDEAGRSILHMHAAAGREGRATVGCTRAGVAVWLVGECVMLELLGTPARRAREERTGFELLDT